MHDLEGFIGSYQAKSNKIDWEKMLQAHKDPDSSDNIEKKILVKRYKDAVYFGNLNKEGKREGLGVMIYSSDRRYEGGWKADVR